MAALMVSVSPSFPALSGSAEAEIADFTFSRADSTFAF
jgi:hypothetical protein